jgi:16S rRNA (uracil1498-N3)-methyltransferase
MHRFYLPPEECHGPFLLLTGAEAHHASNVLRLRQGELVLVLDGVGHEFSCGVREHGHENVRLEILSSRSEPQPEPQITLVQALPKGKLMESIIQKATELGAHCVVPVFTERVVSKFDVHEAHLKQRKWQSVAIEAIKQCGGLWLTTVEHAAKYTQFLSRPAQFDLQLIGSLQPGSRHPRDYFKEFRAKHGRKPASACVWIGPEGDFTPGEIEEIQGRGAKPITLGPRVLRTETAACYCLSVLNYEHHSPE